MNMAELNPITDVERYVDAKLQEGLTALEIKVKIAIAVEDARIALARALQLDDDPKNKANYSAALTALGE